MDTPPLETRAERLHQSLPGIVRATLNDQGISSSVIDRWRIGWDGKHVVVPVRDLDGRICFFEEWQAEEIGMPVKDIPRVELFGAELLRGTPERIVIAEGIHEALVFERNGLPAVAATGSGRFFKAREWKTLLEQVPEIILAYREGEHHDRRLHRLSRSGVMEKVLLALPNATVVTWPKVVGGNGGAFEFFVDCGRSQDNFLRLLGKDTDNRASS